ncbi:MAG TPA: tyrosine-type recombinase/integrase [Acidobacteriaceae bacterium]
MVRVTVFWRGDSAYLNWRANGERNRPSIGKLSEREAEEYRAAKEAELNFGVRIISTAPPVRDFLISYLDWYKAEHPTTYSKAKSEVKRFIARFGHRPIDSINAFEVEQYKVERLTVDKAAKETVGKEIRRLSAAFKRGIGWKLFDTNPVAGVTAPKGIRSVAVKFYDAKALDALYNANPMRAALWKFMAHTGARRGEMPRLTKDQVVRGRLHIESVPDENDVGRTKSGKWRDVPLNKSALEALEQLPHALVSVHRDTLTDWFGADAKAAKIGGSLHRLRHTFGANLTMAGVPLRRVQILMGHSDYATTEKYYAHLTPEGDDGAVKLLDTLLVTAVTKRNRKDRR